MSEPQDLFQFSQKDRGRIASGLMKAISEDPECKFSLEHHVPEAESDEFTAGSHWTLTAKSETQQLEATMIVRGNPWWTRSKMWFTKDGTQYEVDEDLFNETPEFKSLETFFMSKADQEGRERDRKMREDKDHEKQISEGEINVRANQLISSLERDLPPNRLGIPRRNPERG